jgi:hypothetical protein
LTTIVGIEHGGKVWLGGDSAISIGDDRIEIARDPKVWIRDGIAFGSAGSLRPFQLAKHTLKIPKLPRSQKPEALHVWLVKDLSAALRECWSVDTGKAPPEKFAADLLLGVRGWLCYVDWDFAFMRPRSGVAALGTGGDSALGSLAATAHLKRPKERLVRALDTAAACTNGTRPPFTYVSA